MNVIPSTLERDHPVLIDWGAARIGPRMFDVAMASPPDDDGAVYHQYCQTWETSESTPSPTVHEYSWAGTLISAMFAAVVANRGDTEAAMEMIEEGEASYSRFLARDFG